MRVKGKVLSINGTTAQVAVVRRSACGADCASCKGCSTESQTLVVALTANSTTSVGQVVDIHMSGRVMLMLAQLTYLVPVLMLFVGYWLGSSFGEGVAIISSFTCLAASFFIVRLFNKMAEKIMKNNIYIA